MNIEAKNSEERVEDVCFQNLIRRWGEQRKSDWVIAASAMYGHILEERERNGPEPGTPENPIIGVVVDDEPNDDVDASPGPYDTPQRSTDYAPELDDMVSEQFEDQLTKAVEEEVE